ncbi:MAG: type II secretion system F family protein [Holosporales bacterium]|jgi:type IV pilus assembly protein PilC|nr:type II secretion system F family protein [Holosporales bacterium]
MEVKLYKYKTIDRFGNIVINFAFSSNKENLLRYLKSNDEIVVYIRNQKEKIKNSLQDFTLLFFKNLYPLIANKLDLSTALRIVAELFKNREKKAIVKYIIYLISCGASLSKSLAEFNKYFDGLIIKSIEIAETTATLDVIILNIIEYLEAKLKVKSKIKSAILYPVILFCVMFSIFLFWIIYIVPNFVDLFYDIGIEIPTTTKIIVSFRSFIIYKSWIAFIIVAILLGINNIRKYCGGLLRKMPIFNNYARDLFAIRFFFSMKVMLKGKINLIDALKYFANNKNEYNIANVPEIIKKGSTLSVALRSLNLFREHELSIVKAGEKSGALWQAFETVSNILQAKIDEKTTRIISLVQPVSIILIGILLITVIYSVFMPLYSNLDIT